VLTAPSSSEAPAAAEAATPVATVAPWLGVGVVGAGATLRF
jgi:hypothetical protein